jgi:hypothetical protein
MGRFGLIVAVVLLGLGPRGAMASDLGPRWFSVDAGFGIAGGSLALGDGSGGVSIMAGMSHPLARELRATFEMGFQRVVSSGQGIAFPDFEVTQDPSNVATALIGIELYGPIRGGSGPFVRESFGLGYISRGDQHTHIFDPVSDQVRAVDLHGDWEVRPAIDLAAGFRRLPKQGGLSMGVTFRYLMLPANRGGAHVGSLALGLGF